MAQRSPQRIYPFVALAVVVFVLLFVIPLLPFFLAAKKEFAVLRHDGPINTARFSPDGRLIVTASDDQTSKIWSTNTGQELVTLRGHEDKVYSAEFSPNGTRIVTTSWNWKDKTKDTARIWDANTGKQLNVLQHPNPVNSAAFSPDSKRLLTTSYGRAVHIWDVDTGKELTNIPSRGDFLHFAAFSPDGTRFVTTSPGRIWDADFENPSITLDEPGRIDELVWSPNGKRIVTKAYRRTPQGPNAHEYDARIWDAQTGRQLATLQSRDRHDHLFSSFYVAFSPDSKRFVTTTSVWSVHVWDADTGKELVILRGHTGSVWSAEFSPNGKRIITASFDKTVRIWNAASGEQLAALQHESSVRSAKFSPDGKRILTTSEDQTARIWK